MDIHKHGPARSIWLVGLLVSLLAGGCASGDGTAVPINAGSQRLVTGNVSKGPLNGATIRVYEIDARGQPAGPVLDEAVTDDSGNWSLAVPVDIDNLVIESSAGVYVDEADTESDPDRRRTIQLTTDDSFSALLPANTTTVAINIYTDALLRKSRHETQGANFFDVYQLNRSLFVSAFGFDITTTQPADPVRPDAAASLQSRTYAMALGGAANAVNALAIENQMATGNFQIISALIDDLTDCMIDGQSVAGPLLDIETLTLSLNAEILRFRNNNFNVYQQTPVLVIDQNECARSGQVADRIAPEFAGLPGDFSIEALDDQGVSSAIAGVQTRLQGIQAVDDRDGVIAAVSNLPAFLPIGPNTVTYTASDLAGNTRTIALIITVVLPQPPTIIAPRDIVTEPTGALTQVDLGVPVISDNVTVAADLVVGNDAPAEGFVPGDHLITWTVTDEAGLSSQAIQEVRVRRPGFDQGQLDPGYGQLPTLPDPGQQVIPPIGRPIPNTAGNRLAPLGATDSDQDGLPDNLEWFLGTDPYNRDSDHDGIDDNLEKDIGSDPLTASVLVRVPVSGGPADYDFSFAATRADRPAFVLFEPGLHFAEIRLAPPCDHVVLIGNSDTTDQTGDQPATQATIAGWMQPALTINGCYDVKLYRMNFSDSSRGGVDLIDSQATIYRSSFNRNHAIRGAAIRLIRSHVNVHESSLHGNAATIDDGAIRIGPDSSADVVDSVLTDY